MLRRTVVLSTILAVLLTALPAIGTVASTAVVGGHTTSTDAVLDDAGRAVIVTLPLSGNVLELTRCLDVACTQRSGPREIPGLTPQTLLPKMDLDPAGNPVIAYGQQPPRDGGGNVGTGGGSTRLELARCTDPDCTATTPPVVLHTASRVLDLHEVVVDPAGNPAVLYSDLDEGMFLIRCNDPACSGDDEVRTRLRNRVQTASMVLDGQGNPIIAYGAALLSCDDPACADEQEVAVAGFDAAAIVLDDAGAPVLAGRLSTSPTTPAVPAVVTCGDRGCATPTTVSLGDIVEGPADLTLTEDGRPLVLLLGSGGISVAVCQSTTCTGEERATPLVAGSSPSTATAGLVGAGLLVLVSSSVVDGARETSVTTCDDPACTVGTGPVVPSTTPAQEAAIAYAIEVSQERFPGRPGRRSEDPTVLATIAGFADALAGTPLTADAPLLLTTGEVLHPDVLEELERLDNSFVYLLGGTAALSQALEDQLRARGYFVERLAGPSRIETAAAVADEVRAEQGGAFGEGALARAFPAEGNPTSGWADAIAVGGWLASTGMRIALAPAERGDPTVEAYIGGAYERLLLVGGPAAVPAAYDTEVSTRISGTNRFETARRIALDLWEQPEEGARTYLVLDATDELGWAYGLAAAGLSSDLGAAMLTVGDTTPPETLAAVAGCGGQVTLRAVGPVADAVLAQLDDADSAAC